MNDENSDKGSPESSVKSRTMGENVELKKWVAFHINNELYAVEALNVLEVQKYTEITPVPGSMAYILGLINLRGKVITVIDTRMLFKLPKKPIDDKTIIILIEFNEEEVVGLIVDDVDEVLDIATKNIEVSPKSFGSSTASEFIKGVTYSENNMIIILDIQKINAYIAPLNEDTLD